MQNDPNKTFNFEGECFFKEIMGFLNGLCQNDVISLHQKSRMKHCNNHLKLSNNINEIQQKEREASMNTNGRDWIGLHLGDREKNRPDFFQVYGK